MAGRLCCCVFPRFISSVAVLLGAVCARRCGSGGAFCALFAVGVTALLLRFALGSCRALRLCCCVLPLAHVGRCGSVGAFVLGSRLLFAAWRQTGRLVLAVLVRLSVLAETRSWSARRCAFCRRAWPRFTPGLAVLLRCFAVVHACLFSFVRKKETACDALRFYSAGRDRHSCVLIMLARLSVLARSLRVWPFISGDLDGLPGTRERGTGLAARRLCAFARSH